ncbi:unnamed protein product, partial [Mesorhabditis spiculigera]
MAPRMRKSISLLDISMASQGSSMNGSFAEGEHLRSPITPLALVKRLEMYKEQIFKSDNIELNDFDMSLGDTVEYERKRAEMLLQTRVGAREEMFLAERTGLNMENAVIAGAKLLVDEHRCSRSVIRRLQEECGVSESDILYKGLEHGRERAVLKDVSTTRTSSVVESYVDFRKQIGFKMQVLEGIVAKTRSEGAPMATRKRRQETEAENKPPKLRPQDLKTPKRVKSTAEIDVHDVNNIMGKYALEVASEIRHESHNSMRMRKIAPIPLDFSVLDDIRN